MNDELKYIPNMPIPDILNEFTDDNAETEIKINFSQPIKPLVGSLEKEEISSIRKQINNTLK